MFNPISDLSGYIRKLKRMSRRGWRDRRRKLRFLRLFAVRSLTVPFLGRSPEVCWEPYRRRFAIDPFRVCWDANEHDSIRIMRLYSWLVPVLSLTLIKLPRSHVMRTSATYRGIRQLKFLESRLSMIEPRYLGVFGNFVAPAFPLIPFIYFEISRRSIE